MNKSWGSALFMPSRWVLAAMGILMGAVSPTSAQTGDVNAIYQLIRDINPGPAPADSVPAAITATSDRLFFTASDGVHGAGELWMNDGGLDSNSTVRVLSVAATNGITGFQSPAVLNGVLHFVADRGGSDLEVWKITNKTLAGARADVVTNLNASGSSEAQFLTVAGSRLYFLAKDVGAQPLKLWTATTNGLPQTVRSNGVSVITGATVPVASGTNLYFARNTAAGVEVWVAQGTNAYPAVTLPGSASGTATELALTPTRLFIAFDDGSDVTMRWMSLGGGGMPVAPVNEVNGAAVAVQNLTPFGSALLFSGADISSGDQQLHRILVNQTNSSVLTPDSSDAAANFAPDNFTVAGNSVYLTGRDQAGVSDLKRTLWVYGVDDRLRKVRRFTGLGTQARSFAAATDSLYFVARDGVVEQLWQAVSTNAYRLVDSESRAITGPEGLTADGGLLYLSATAPAYGRELWRLTVATTVALGQLLEPPVPLAEPPTLAAFSPGDPTGAVWFADVQKVLFTEPNHQMTIRWRTNDAPFTYFVLPTPSDSVAIYHTEGYSKAPQVDVSSIPYGVVFHDNKLIRGPYTVMETNSFPVGTNESIFIPTPRTYNGNIWVGDDDRIHADGKTGYIVMHYENAGAFHGAETVQLRAYLTDGTANRELGTEIVPLVETNRTDRAERHAFVARGRQQQRTDDGYIYQHEDRGPINGRIFAVRANAVLDNMEVFWMREGQHGVDWPYEMNRFTASWPDGQRYVRRPDTIEPTIEIPGSLNPFKMPEELFSGGKHGYLSGQEFYTDGEGFSLLMFETGPADRRDWIDFQVIHSTYRTNRYAVVQLGQIYTNYATANWPIGSEITNVYHEGERAGYLYTPVGNYYHPALYGEKDLYGMTRGHVFAVNEGRLEVWWSALTHTNRHEHGLDIEGIQWPSYVVQYTNQWPTNGPQVSIASQQGTGPLRQGVYPNWQLYYQNETNLPGFNPNEEHAVIQSANVGQGTAIFPLRDDLNSTNTSKPYLLISYTDITNGLPDLEVFKVNRGTFFYTNYLAGTLVPPPWPLPAYGTCKETTYISGPGWRDRKDNIWARAAGKTGGTSNLVMRFFYPVQPGFYWPSSYTNLYTNSIASGAHVPWLDVAGGKTGTPINVTFQYGWPTNNLKRMQQARTLTKAADGLPEIWGQTSCEIIYQMSTNNAPFGGGPSVVLIDPIWARTNQLLQLPADVETKTKEGYVTFPTLPYHLRERFVYNAQQKKLLFRGKLIEPAAGDPFLLPNIITKRETNDLLNLSIEPEWKEAVNGLIAEAKAYRPAPAEGPFEKLALVSGTSNGFGFVTLAFNNSTNLNGDADPISLEILYVTNTLYVGSIQVIQSDNIFDETLTLRYDGDLAGLADSYQFAWVRGQADDDGTAPEGIASGLGVPFATLPPSGNGALDITISAETHDPIITLGDNYFVMKYRALSATHPAGTNWSAWTDIQLAPGWIKRVMEGINPFEQRFLTFDEDSEVSTLSSMLSQAGGPFEGNVALNAEASQDAGLIQIYQTVLDRGASMSLERNYDYAAANDALLLAAGRLADLYMLLGNEGFADAADPTVGFGTDSGDYGTAASAIHCFMNQTANLLEEELKLLRGRDDSLLPYVWTTPFYNRLIWNTSSDIVGGEVAYMLSYEISDVSGAGGEEDGFINELDAKVLYPQAHGDAWGHYLSAIKSYYRLIQHPNFTWQPRVEAVLVGGTPVNVDYLDERKFASAAAARARTGSEVVNLTYRDRYASQADGQWTGYRDANTNRAWGVAEWATRAGQASYFDWVVANSMLPVEAPGVAVSNLVINPVTGVTNLVHSTNAPTGIQRIDRTTVVEIRELASEARVIQGEIDKADKGLNPLGLSNDILPFDIDPSQIDQGNTHFEQIYGRAVQALNNASTVFNRAQDASRRMRQQYDSVAEFTRNADERAIDFEGRLIEIFGRPYPDDVGPTGSYPTDYAGPDYLHYEYYEPTPALITSGVREITVQLSNMDLDDAGGLDNSPTTIVFHVSNVDLGLVKPPYWTSGDRPAIGEIQNVRSDFAQARGRFDQALQGYDNLINQIQDQVDLLAMQQDVNTEELTILNASKGQQIKLNDQISRSRAKQQDFRRTGSIAVQVSNALAEYIPGPGGIIAGMAAGFIFDWGAFARSAIRQAGAAINEVMSSRADTESLAELDKQQAKEIVSADSNIQITSIKSNLAIEQSLRQIEQLIRQEAQQRLDLYTQEEGLRQIAGRYSSALNRGQRLLDERLRFKKQTAAKIQDYRYKDMSFRIFRDDALQKYRAQLDLAAKYVYMAARAYDYETNFRDGDSRGPGAEFLREIIGARTIGEMNNGVPATSSFDGGLADPMARMTMNWSVLEGQLGFNNPQTETGRFSLRSELFRILPGSGGDSVWRETLQNHVVDNILDIPEFRRYCLPFYPQQAAEPGIVIDFPSTINFGHNFFGWLAGGGDNSYDSANFATKIRSVGVWFANYNNVIGGGMVNTPRVYLVPAGSDLMRSPTDATGETREWTVVDQALPVPFPLSGADLEEPDWIPMFDSLYGGFDEIRKHGSFRAYHDSGAFNEGETISNSRLVGRSVWNTRWLLIIPAGTLHWDRQEGLSRFIDGTKLTNGQRDGNGVKDIKLFFQTYSFEGR